MGDKFLEFETKWRNDVSNASQRDYSFKSASGEDVDLLYYPKENENDYLDRLNFPGQFPYTRGIHPNLYRGKLWTMRQFAGFGTPAETNQRFKHLLKEGQTGLSVAFDMPTLMGYDADHPLSEGEVGMCGVAISSLKDMEILFDGIDLSKISVSMTINGPAAILFAFYVAVAQNQGADISKLNGTLQNDILKEFIAQKEWIYPPDESMRIIMDMIQYCTEKMPKYNTISVSGYHIREAGSTAIQELAFTLADGFCYVENAINSGLDVDEFAPRLSFFFNSHLDFFEEIAKFRAARRIWARIMKDRFNAENPRSMMLRFHTQTAGVTLTAQQPDNNVVRTTIQALAGILGGTQSLHVNSKDEALSLPSEASAELSLRTQQILAHESGIINTVDPLAGSYYVEHLTDQLYEKTKILIDEVEGLGGAISGIENGFQALQIHESAYTLQKEIEAENQIIVGVNKYQKPELEQAKITPVESSAAKSQITKLSKIKASRDNAKVEASLLKLKSVASSDDNTIEPIMECVQSYATVGEISDVLRSVFGEHQETIII